MAYSGALLAAVLLLVLAKQSSCVRHKKDLAAKQDMLDHRLSDDVSYNMTSQKAGRRGADFGRFITFKSSPHDKLTINLEFSVPFISLPLHRSGPFHTQEPVELNVRGILLAAGLGAAAAFVVPLLSDSIASHIEVPANTPPGPWPSST